MEECALLKHTSEKHDVLGAGKMFLVDGVGGKAGLGKRHAFGGQIFVNLESQALICKGRSTDPSRANWAA
jgi:hypothetical protein